MTLKPFQQRPDSDEYSEFYAGYIAKVDGSNILQILDDQIPMLRARLSDLSEALAREVTAPYSWSIKQVLGHLIDGEKVFGYRLHRFAVGDPTELPGFEHEGYVTHLDYETPTTHLLIDELDALRQSNLYLLRRLRDENWLNKGVASGCPFSVRSLAFILAGHVAHHFEIIRKRLGSDERN